MAALSAIGTVGMVTAVAVAVGKLTTLAPPVERTELVHMPRSVNSLVVALLDIVFSYGGQVSVLTPSLAAHGFSQTGVSWL